MYILIKLQEITNKYMPPNDLATELMTGEAEMMTEEELQHLLYKEQDNYEPGND